MDPKVKNILEWGYCIVIAIVIAILIKHFVGTPTVVQMDSMYSTLVQGDRLLLNRIPRTFKKLPKKGDIITFEAPTKQSYNEDEVDLSNPVAKYEYGDRNFLQNFAYNVLEINKTSYIKRVIATPGDYVEIKDGKVYVNNEEIVEDYLDEGTITNNSGYFNKFTVPENTVFAMGDHRAVSMDCRVFGCVPIEKIESTVAIRFWPLNKFEKVK